MQGTIEYVMAGLYPAENFFWVDSQTGAIFVSRSLKADSLKSTEYIVSVLMSLFSEILFQRGKSPHGFCSLS